MTDLERLVDTFRRIGIEPEVTKPEIQDITLVTLNKDNFGGYWGFECVFQFDSEGKFQPNVGSDDRGASTMTGLWE